MPNRLIKESVRTNKSLNGITDFQFRLWTHLVTYVDDFGRGSADPDILKGFLFPLRKNVSVSAIAKGLQALADANIITLYAVNNEPYLYFPAWEKEQTIRAKKSKFPPPDDLQTSASNCMQVNANAPVFVFENTKYENARGDKKRFTPPTLAEVQSYVAERHSPVDPQGFIDFYEAKGWMVGKTPMKDWKAACRNAESWERWQRTENKSAEPTPIYDLSKLVEYPPGSGLYRPPEEVPTDAG